MKPTVAEELKTVRRLLKNPPSGRVHELRAKQKELVTLALAEHNRRAST